jgi:hypothetical protein
MYMDDSEGRPVKREPGGGGVMIGGQYHPGMNEHPVSRRIKMSEPCPPDYSARGMWKNQQPQERRDTVYWTPKQDQMGKFYADIFAATAITQECLSFQDIYHMGSCPPNDDCSKEGWDYGIPAANGYTTADVSNPKDIVTAALTNLTTLHQ